MILLFQFFFFHRQKVIMTGQSGYVQFHILLKDFRVFLVFQMWWNKFFLELLKYCLDKGIEAKIHYPVPMYRQKAMDFLNYKKGDFPVTEKQSKLILSLPINQFLRKNEIIYICNTINNYFNK